MLHQVRRKQNNSRMCFVCGLENQFGLKTSFYETETGELVTLVHPNELHQSYPGRMHGGVAAAILVETIGRAIAIGKDDQVWGVTVELSTKYRKPIPLSEELRIVGRITKEGPRFFEGSGELLLPSGEVAVSAIGRNGTQIGALPWTVGTGTISRTQVALLRTVRDAIATIVR